MTSSWHHRPERRLGRSVVALCIGGALVVSACSSEPAPTPLSVEFSAASTDVASSGPSAAPQTQTRTLAAPTHEAAESKPASIDVAEVKRQVELYLSPGGRYDELIKSIVITVDGQPVVQHFSADSGPDVHHNGYSVTKSVMSMLIGIAIEEGAIAGVDRTLADLLPQYVPVMAPGVGAVTLEQVLTMTGGIVEDEFFTAYAPTADWTQVTLSRPLSRPPGTGFAYSSPGSHLLSAILTKATGQSTLDYAREKLFGPLQIESQPAAEPTLAVADIPAYDRAAGFGWSTDPQGLNLGFVDLKLTATDMTKLGQLNLDEGRWQGHQVLPAGWVRTSTSAVVPWDAGPGGYGYQWWISESHGYRVFAAMGRGGQLIEVIPDLRMIVVVSCLNGVAAFDPESFGQLVNQIVDQAVAG